MVFAIQGEDEKRNNCTFDSSIFEIFLENHTLTDKHCQSDEGKKGLGPKGGKKPCIETGPYKKLLTSHGFKASKTTKKTTDYVKPTPQQRLSFDKPVAKDHPTIITEYSSDYSYK